MITAIEDKNRSDGFGNIIPGLLVFKKLEKKGLVFFTKEDPIDINGEPFYFTPSVELDYQAFNKLVKDEPACNLMAKSK